MSSDGFDTGISERGMALSAVVMYRGVETFCAVEFVFVSVVVKSKQKYLRISHLLSPPGTREKLGDQAERKYMLCVLRR